LGLTGHRISNKRRTPIDAFTTAYGRPAIELLADQISELKNGDRLAPVTVIVTSNSLAVATRRALAERPGGIANVTFTTLRRLAEQFGGPGLAAAGRRPVSAPIITAAVRTALAEEPGIFDPVADHPATEQALAEAHRELSTVPDHALDPVAACSPRARDVIRIHRTVRQHLAENWHDEDDLVRAASDAFDARQHLVTGPVVLHLSSEFTAAEAELLHALARHNQVLANVGITGDRAADAAVLAAHRRAGIDVDYPDRVQVPDATKVLSASDPDEEVRAAVRQVTTWMQEGTRLGRIAVLYPNPDPYARLLQEHLAAAGIPATGMPVRALQDLLFGRALRALLALPDHHFRRADVLGLLSGQIILDGDDPVPHRAWERVSRKAGVVSGADWDIRLAALAEEERDLAKFDENDGHALRAAHRRNDADRAEALAGFVKRLRENLAAPGQIRSWNEWVSWTTNLADTYLGGRRHRFGWPADEQEAAEAVEAALERLAGLHSLGGPVPTRQVFRRALDSELSVSLRGFGRSGADVLVGPVSTVAGMTFDRLIMLGMAEGRFPARRLQDSLLPDAERREAGGYLRLRADRVHDDRRALLAALAGAEQAVLSRPRGDLRRSTEQTASRWLLENAARLAEVPTLTTAALDSYTNNSALDRISSFSGGLAHHQHSGDLSGAAVGPHRPRHPRPPTAHGRYPHPHRVGGGSRATKR
jgi:hypothetical protein